MVWLNLVGFTLRPGYGYPGDEQRIEELWRTFRQGLFFPNAGGAKAQWWILWRRVAGGLPTEAQERVFDTAFSVLKGRDADRVEVARTLASLERVSLKRKKKLAALFVEQLLKSRTEFVQTCAWGLGRLGSRALLYAEPEHRMPSTLVEAWFWSLQELDWSNSLYQGLRQSFLLAGRLVDDEEANLTPEIRAVIEQKLLAGGVESEKIEPLRTIRELETSELDSLFGDTLPHGLKLLRTEEE